MDNNYQLSATIIGAEELKAAINSVDQVAIKAIVDAVNITAEHIEREARSNAPHKTGTLWRSLHVGDPDNKGASYLATVTGNNVKAAVGTNLKYARAQEKGTVGMVINVKNGRKTRGGGHTRPYTYIGNIKPKFYLARAIDSVRTQFTDNLSKAMQQIVSHLATKPSGI